VRMHVQTALRLQPLARMIADRHAPLADTPCWLARRAAQFGFSADAHGMDGGQRQPDDRVSEIWEGHLDVHGTVPASIVNPDRRPAAA
jgi:hypothetical protein